MKPVKCSYKEKRKHKRIKVALSTIILPEKSDNPLKNIEISDTEDISTGGISIAVQEHVSMNSTVYLSFFIPFSNGKGDALQLINAKAVMVRLEKIKNLQRSKNYRAGFKFTSLGEEHHTKLSNFINKK